MAVTPAATFRPWKRERQNVGAAERGTDGGLTGNAPMGRAPVRQPVGPGERNEAGRKTSEALVRPIKFRRGYASLVQPAANG